MNAYNIAMQNKVHTSLPFRKGVREDPFLAFGEIGVSDKYVLLECIICNKVFESAFRCFKGAFSFPHVTVAKLAFGWIEYESNWNIRL